MFAPIETWLNLSGNILDDEELIETLSSSKIMGTKIEEQVKQQEITAVQIAEVRQVYKCFRCKQHQQPNVGF